jgi:coenzyme Q-binding protein COQ10
MNMKKYLFMKYIAVSFAWGLLFLCPCAAAKAPDFADNLGKIVSQGDNYKIRLVEGQGEGVKTAEAVFLVKAKPEAVFKAVTDFDHYPEFMPNITKVACVECKNKDKRYRFTLKVAFWDINYTLLLKSSYKDDRYSLTWEYVEGDIRDTSGSWRIGPYDKDKGYSLIFYRVKTDPGRFVPDWVADRLSTKSIPDMIEAVSKRSVESR